MSTHAEEVARLKDAVVEAAKAERALQLAPGPMSSRERLHRRIPLEVSLKNAVDAIIAAEALTCETCEGIGIRIRDMQNPKCPACHGTGRKPDTFRDDGATTPEGCEDPDDRGGEVPGA